MNEKELCILELAQSHKSDPTIPSADHFQYYTWRDTENDPHWSWLGLACETRTSYYAKIYEKHEAPSLEYTVIS